MQAGSGLERGLKDTKKARGREMRTCRQMAPGAEECGIDKAKYGRGESGNMVRSRKEGTEMRNDGL